MSDLSLPPVSGDDRRAAPTRTGILVFTVLVTILFSACSDLSTGFELEPRYCGTSEQAPLLGHPYQGWPDRYGVRLHSMIETEPVATELAEHFGLELRGVHQMSDYRLFYADIQDGVVPILRCDSRIRHISHVGPPIPVP